MNQYTYLFITAKQMVGNDAVTQWLYRGVLTFRLKEQNALGARLISD